MKIKTVILTLAVATLVSQALLASTYSWNNGGTDWATAANWSTAVPTATDIASFNPQSGTGTTINNPVITGTGNVASALNINNNFLGGVYSFSGTGTLTLGGAVTVRGIGTQTISGPILKGAAAGNLTFNVGADAGLTLAGATTATTNSGAVNINGGMFTIDNSTSTTAKLSGNAVSMNGGGTLALVGNASGTTLSLGNLTTTDNSLGGNNVIKVTPNGAATVVNFAATSTGSLRGGTRSTWDFQAAGGNLGDANGARITFTSAPFVSSANGLFANTATGATVGFATVTDALGKNFATYNTAGTTAIGVVSIANTGQTIATVTTVTSAANLAALTAASKGQFNAPTGTTTASGTITSATLRVSPASGATLAMGSNGLTVSAIMLDGANDFALSGSGSFGSGTSYIYVNNTSTTLSTSMVMIKSNAATVFAGPGVVDFTSATSQNSSGNNNNRISVTGGVLRATPTNGGFAAASGGVFSLTGGVLEIKNGSNGTGASADFTRSLGSSAGNVNFGGGTTAEIGSGGFSAFGAPASVNIGGAASPSTLTWGATVNFVGDGYALKFGSTKSNAVLTFLNPLALDSGTAGTYAAREINVTAGTGGDKTVISGVVGGSSTTDLIKTGAGVLEFKGTNTYMGNTLIQQGSLVINGNQINALGAVTVSGAGTLLAGTGTVGGDTTINAGAIHSPGAVGAVGRQTFDHDGGDDTTNLTYKAGSIFSWDLASTPATSGRGTSYDAVDVNGTLTGPGGAIFRVVLNGSQNFSEEFWKTTRTWSDIFSGDNADGVNLATIFSGGFEYYNSTTGALNNIPTTQGSFKFTGDSLTWTAVPEPTTALAGLLLGAGMLRRRRK